MTASPHIKQIEQWVERAMGQVSDELALVRNQVITLSKLKRNDLVLDINAGAGLLTWPAIRHTIEGGVWSYCIQREEAQSMSALARELPWAHQPQIFYGDLDQGFLSALKDHDIKKIKFDKILARSFFTHRYQWSKRLQILSELVDDDHRIKVTIAEPYLYGAQRLSSLLSHSLQESNQHTYLIDQWRNAEALIYKELNHYWHQEELLNYLKRSTLNISDILVKEVLYERKIRLTSERVKEWLRSTHESYISRITKTVDDPELLSFIEDNLQQMASKKVKWRVTWLLLQFDLN